MTARRSPFAAVIAIAALAALIGGCTSDNDGDAGSSAAASSSSRPSTAGSSTAPTASTTASTPATSAASGTPSATGCPPSGAGVPAGAASRPTVDVDGDGRADTAWLVADAPTRLGITTASGASFETSVTFAGGSQPSALVADVTGKGEVIALVTNGRVVDLLRIADCSFTVVTNPQSEPYTFDLGFTGFGTGVGCVDVTGDGVRDLVGLKVERGADGQPTRITRTQVTLNGAKADNGVTGDVPITPAAVDSAQSITCGDATMENDGVHA